MEQFFDRFKIDCSPKAHDSHTIVKGGIRITVITPCLVRVEEQSKGKFCDEPTQSVWFRDFCESGFDVKENGGKIEIKTEKVTFVYSLKAKKMLTQPI